MIFKILNAFIDKIIGRSSVRLVDEDKLPNLRADNLTSPEVIKSLHDDSIANTEDTASKDNGSPSS